MDRKNIFLIALVFIALFAWQMITQQKQQAPTQLAVQTTPQQTIQATPQQAAPAASLSAQSKVRLASLGSPEKLLLSSGEATPGDGLDVFSAWKLKDYTVGIHETTAAIDLSFVTNEATQVRIGFYPQTPELARLLQARGSWEKTAGGIAWNYEDENVKLRREITADPALPYLDSNLNFQFKTAKPSYVYLILGSKLTQPKDNEEQDRKLIYFGDNSLQETLVKGKISYEQSKMPSQWIGVSSRYFAMAIINKSTLPAHAVMYGEQEGVEGAGKISMAFPVSQSSLSIPVRFYFGPKELNTLRIADPTLDHAVDLGWFTFVAYPLLKMLKWFYGYVHNYGVAIILLTILVKTLLFPLTYKGAKGMKRMSDLQPYMQKIREKYKDDKEGLNREMMALMKTGGYNPVSGCLPIMLQMPVFIALYRVLYSSIELYHAPFIFWIHDLSEKDPFYVTPILMTALMFFQQKLTPTTATDPTQAKMLQYMPIMFGVFMLFLPSGLTLYMLVNSITSILQQMYLNKKLGIRTGALTVSAPTTGKG